MITYITAFIFYTLAMIGILIVGYVVYKKTILTSKKDNKGMIKVIDSLPIGPKKTLLVVKIRNEKFLIASGAEHTTFLSKLADDENRINSKNSKQTTQNINKNLDLIPSKQDYEDFKNSEINEFKEKSQPRFDDIERLKLEKLQKQFNQLYAKATQNPAIKDINGFHRGSQRKEILRELLNDLNKQEANFNG